MYTRTYQAFSQLVDEHEVLNARAAEAEGVYGEKVEPPRLSPRIPVINLHYAGNGGACLDKVSSARKSVSDGELIPPDFQSPVARVC